MFFRTLSALLACAMAWTPALLAQRLGVVPRRGQTVSVTNPETRTKVTGRVADIGPDSTVIQTATGNVILGSHLLSKARVATGSTKGITQGITIGTLAGLAVGTVIGLASVEGCPTQDIECAATIFAVPGHAMSGLLGGGLLGGLLGSAVTVPVWSRGAPPGAVPARFNADLTTGDAVRLIESNHKARGLVVGGSDHMAIVRLESGSDTAVDLRVLERYTGDRMRVGKGLEYGAAIGAAAGVAIYLFDPLNPLYGASTAGELVRGTLLLSVVGAGLGALTEGKPHPAWAPVVAGRGKSFSLSPILRPGRVGVVGRLAW